MALVLNETYLIGLMAILINGVITGFAVYIGSHAGKRVIDNYKEKTNKEREEFLRLYKIYKDEIEIPKAVGEVKNA